MNRSGAMPFDQVSVETFGGRLAGGDYEEVSVTAAVQHQDPNCVGLFLRELIGAALATPPGLHFFTGAGRPKPSPVVALHSTLVDSGLPEVMVSLDDREVPFAPAPAETTREEPTPHLPETVDPGSEEMAVVLLEDLAVARSGDKGDTANIGVMARQPVYLPWIWDALTPKRVAECFAEELKGAVERHYLPGTHALNIVLHQVLGGGGIASLRNDSQGKSYAQRLLAMPVSIPAHLVSNTQRRAG